MKVNLNLTEPQAKIVAQLLHSAWQSADEIARLQVGMILKQIQLKLEELTLKKLEDNVQKSK